MPALPPPYSDFYSTLVALLTQGTELRFIHALLTHPVPAFQPRGRLL